MSNQLIDCSVTACRYNERGQRCALEIIEIQHQRRARPEQADEAAQTQADTFCASFELR